MTPDVYRKKWLRLHQLQEKKGVTLFRQAIIANVDRIPQDSITPLNAQAKITLALAREPVQKALQSYYLQVGGLFGHLVGESIHAARQLKRFTSSGFTHEFTTFLLDWLKANGAAKVASINNNLAQYLLEQITLGLESAGQGPDIRSIVRRLKEDFRFKTTYRWQLLRIVRTETTAAANLGSIRAGVSSGVVWEKEWLSALDPRTRTRPEDVFDHGAMHRVRVGSTEDFNVQGDRLAYPGDPKGQIANTVNCRCAVAIVPKLDSEGLPVLL